MKVEFNVDDLDDIHHAVSCLRNYIADKSIIKYTNIMEVYHPFSENQDVIFRCSIDLKDDEITVTKMEIE